MLCLCLGCSSITGRFADSLTRAVLDQEDAETVRAGGPSYLILVEAFLKDDPDNIRMLQTASELYAAYADLYVTDRNRARLMTEKSLSCASRAVCLSDDRMCGIQEMPFDAFESVIREQEEDEISLLFTLGAAWAGWIKAHREDWNAVAQISRVETVVRRVVQVDAAYRDGGGHFFMGILATLLPPAMGGNPEEGRAHFERALSLSDGRNLRIKVAFARQYARMVLDRELHDRLLNEVANADPHAEGYTLFNVMAQKEARALLESAEEYF